MQRNIENDIQLGVSSKGIFNSGSNSTLDRSKLGSNQFIVQENIKNDTRHGGFVQSGRCINKISRQNPSTWPEDDRSMFGSNFMNFDYALNSASP